MQIKSVLFIGLIITAALIAGCTSSTPAPTATPTPQIIYVTVTATETTAPAPTLTTTAATVATTAAPDPILHRWVRRYQDTSTGQWIGYEFIFYPDGTTAYNEGLAQMSSSNIKIVPDLSATGSWTKIGDVKYIVKINPVLIGGAPIVREYEIVGNHIESSYEEDSIPKYGGVPAGSMSYPELAKID